MKDKYLIVLSSIIAFLLSFYANFYGLGLTHDSKYYIEQAKTLSETGVIDYLNKSGFQQKLLIILIDLLPDPSCRSFAWINSLCFAGSVLMWGFVTQHLIQEVRFFRFALFLLVFNTPMLLGTSFLWTEPLFYLVISVYGYFLLINESSWKFPILILISLVLVFIRKAGIVFLGFSILFGIYRLIYPYFQNTVIPKVIILGLAFAGSALFFSYTSFEQPTFTFFFQNLYYQFQTSGKWISPFLPAWILIPFLLLISIVLFSSTSNANSICFLVVVAYGFVRLFFEREFPEENERYLSVVYPFFIIPLTYTFQYVSSIKNWKKWMMMVFLLIIFYNILRSMKNILIWHEVFCS